MQVANIDINKLIPYINNPRNNEEAIDKVASSIKEFGFKVPIVVDKDNVIVTGHTRLLASKKLGLKEVPVVVADDLTDAQIKAFRIADNKVSEYATWDEELLKLELEQLEEMDFDLDSINIDYSDFGLEIELGDFDEEYNEENDIIEEPTKAAFSKQQDIWLLGKHRLMCGDSYKDIDIEKLLNGDKAAIVFTDPPYDLENEDYFINIEKYSEDAHVFVMHDDKGIVEYLRKSNLEFKRFFVANFVFSSPRGNDPYLKHILISHEHNGNPIPHKNLHDGFSSIINMEYRGTLKDDKTEHKHQKSIKFINKFIEHYSNECDICFDLFGGSGSTLISCDISNRINYSMELDERYVDVIVKRYINHKQNNGEDVYLLRNGEKISYLEIEREFNKEA